MAMKTTSLDFSSLRSRYCHHWITANDLGTMVGRNPSHRSGAWHQIGNL